MQEKLIDFSEKNTSRRTDSYGCCIKWHEGNYYYKTSSFDFGWNENLSELIVSDLLRGCPYDFVKYEPCKVKFWNKGNLIIKDAVESRTFLEEGEVYIDAFALITSEYSVKAFERNLNAEERYHKIISIFNSVCDMDCTPFLNFMFTLDFIIGNVDRHLGNFGVIRQLGGGCRLAPIFDNGLSLLAKGKFADYNESQPFTNNALRQLELTKSMECIEFIKSKNIDDLLSDYTDKVDMDLIKRNIAERIEKAEY